MARKLPKKMKANALFALLHEGRLTLQIPTIAISFSGQSPTPDTSEEFNLLPTDVEWLNGDMLPVGNMTLLFWTESGYNRFKIRMRREFSSCRGHTWVGFERKAEAHFAEIKGKLDAKIARTRVQLQTLEDVLNRRV